MFQSRFATFLVVVLVVVAGVSSFVALQPQASSAAAAKPPVITSQATIDKGNLTVTVTATGSFLTAQSSNLTFDPNAGGSGIVTTVSVQQGDQVKAGQVLATIDSSSQQSSVKQAQLNLQAAQAALNKILEPVDPNTLALAQASVQSAKGSLQSKEMTVTQSSIAVAQDKLQQAITAKSDADKLLADAGGRFKNNDPNYQLALAQDGAAGFNVAIAQLELQEAQKGTPLGSAQASIVLSQAKLAQTAAGPTQQDIDSAQNAVLSAQDQLTIAQQTLAKTSLVAPYDGVITTVNLSVGQPASGVAMVIANLNSLYANVNVDESDITTISPGQKVSFTVDALPGVTITGKVDRVIPIADTTASVITYPVHITLDSTTQPIRSGMTINATFDVKDIADVVRIPNNFLQINSSGFVTANRVNADGLTVTTVPLRVGVQGTDYTEVIQGLSVGDQVALVAQASQ